jgi:hypothetical protein
MGNLEIGDFVPEKFNHMLVMTGIPGLIQFLFDRVRQSFQPAAGSIIYASRTVDFLVQRPQGPVQLLIRHPTELLFFA